MRKKVMVTGSRGWKNELAIEFVLATIDMSGPFMLVHGGASGADSIAGRWAEKNRVLQRHHIANWNLYGKSAGLIRNEEMLKSLNPANGDIVLAFWDGSSPGTKHAIDTALKMKLDISVFFDRSANA